MAFLLINSLTFLHFLHYFFIWFRIHRERVCQCWLTVFYHFKLDFVVRVQRYHLIISDLLFSTLIRVRSVGSRIISELADRSTIRMKVTNYYAVILLMIARLISIHSQCVGNISATEMKALDEVYRATQV